MPDDHRSYGDPCGIARALDLIGDRWALLVVRELTFGPKRFGQLRQGLHGASPNVLSQRLRRLEQAGVLTRRRLEPPASVDVYELTDRGYQLEPVLIELGRWGSRTPQTATGDLGTDALLLAMKTTFDAAAAGDLRATYALRLGDDRFRITLDAGRLTIRRGTPDAPDAVLETDAATLRAVVFAGRPFADAEREGAFTVAGSRRAATRLVRLFPRPAVSP